MAAKKSAKTVLEYDPLAWLKEDESKSEKSGGKTTGRKKNAPKKVSQKAVKKTSGSKSSTVKETLKNPAVKKEDAITETAVVENVNFGFFDTGDEVMDSEIVALEADTAAISLGRALTIKTVAEIKQCIDENLALNGDIRLDSTELQKIDTAGLQLLFSLQKSLNDDGQNLTWANKNSAIESAASLIGLPDLFGKTTLARYGLFKDEADGNNQNPGFGFF